MRMLVALDIEAWLVGRRRAQYVAKVCDRFEGVDNIWVCCRLGAHKFDMAFHA